MPLNLPSRGTVTKGDSLAEGCPSEQRLAGSSGLADDLSWALGQWPLSSDRPSSPAVISNTHISGAHHDKNYLLSLGECKLHDSNQWLQCSCGLWLSPGCWASWHLHTTTSFLTATVAREIGPDATYISSDPPILHQLTDHKARGHTHFTGWKAKFSGLSRGRPSQ